MQTKKEKVKILFDQLDSTISRDFFNSGNDTISKNGLLEISHGITKYLNRESDKAEIVRHICTQLQIPPNDEHIGNQGQISAKFIEDIIEFLPKD